MQCMYANTNSSSVISIYVFIVYCINVFETKIKECIIGHYSNWLKIFIVIEIWFLFLCFWIPIGMSSGDKSSFSGFSYRVLIFLLLQKLVGAIHILVSLFPFLISRMARFLDLLLRELLFSIRVALNPKIE